MERGWGGVPQFLGCLCEGEFMQELPSLTPSLVMPFGLGRDIVNGLEVSSSAVLQCRLAGKVQ